MMLSWSVLALAAPAPRLTVAPLLVYGGSLRLDLPFSSSFGVLADLGVYAFPYVRLHGEAPVGSEPRLFYPVLREKVGADWSFGRWFLGPRLGLHQAFLPDGVQPVAFTNVVFGYRHISPKGTVLHLGAGPSLPLTEWDSFMIYPALELRVGKTL
jgi:hypothetical protein